MATDRVRIYDLARELGVPNKVLINTLKGKLNIVVKSHSSTISEDEAEKVKGILSKNEAPKKADEKPIEKPKETPVAKEETPSTPKEPSLSQPETKQPIQPPKEKPVETPKTEAPIQPQVTQQQPRKEKPTRDFSKPNAGFQKRTRDEHKPTHEKSLHQSLKHRIQDKDERNKKPTTPNRPYQVSGDKYRRRPEGRTQQESRFKKPSSSRLGYKPKETTHDASTAPVPHLKREFKLTKPVAPTEQKVVKPEERKPEIKKQEVKPVEEKRTREGIKTDKPKKLDGFREKKPFRPQKEGEKKAPFKEKAAEKPSDKTAKPAKPAKQPFKKDFTKKKSKYGDLKPLSEVFKKKAKPPKKVVEVIEPEKPTEVTITADITVGDLSEKLVAPLTEVVKELFMMGFIATVNETVSQETAKAVSEKLGYTVLTEEAEKEEEEEAKEEVEEEKEPEVDNENLISRAPIVTILGHVDHGKTTLLDAIRKSKHKIVDTEVGGITQSIGAYTVELDKKKKIVFIDTPGHHAFTAMRARGAEVTDIAILIVAADDGIMPQTIEAINHAKAAKVPIIVAVNKVDKAGSDPDRVLQQLTEHALLPEAWGGDTVTVNISAIKGDNIEELLEMISLVAEIGELKADPTADPTGVVIEAELDKGKGPLASVLIQNGTLKVGDKIVVGNVGGKVRALISDSGERVDSAGPSTPVEILGLSEVPQAGDPLSIVQDDKSLKQLIAKKKMEEKEKRFSTSSPIKLKKDTIFKAKKNKGKEEVRELNLIIKADTDGSVQAVESVLLELQSKEVIVKMIHTGVGDITEADVMLAATSNAMIVGFRVKEDPNIAKVEEAEDVSIKTYEIIYQISEEIEKTMLGLLQPELKEVELGTAEVRNLFTVGKNIVIAGCYVLEGKIVRNRKATILRENKPIFTGNLDNLKRFKDDAKEVQSGFECGISFNRFNDLKEGDLITVIDEVEIERESLN